MRFPTLLAELPGNEFPGIDGFLPGSRATIMLDVVFLAMFAVIPVMTWSINLVKRKQNYSLHKRVQLTLGIVLLVAVTAFELDMQFISGWRERAAASPHYASPSTWNHLVGYSLAVHLFFAIPTALLWIFVITQALRNFPSPPTPGPYSPTHIRWAKLAALEMLLTAVTGWVFYWLAFMAK